MWDLCLGIQVFIGTSWCFFFFLSHAEEKLESPTSAKTIWPCEGSHALIHHQTVRRNFTHLFARVKFDLAQFMVYVHLCVFVFVSATKALVNRVREKLQYEMMSHSTYYVTFHVGRCILTRRLSCSTLWVVIIVLLHCFLCVCMPLSVKDFKRSACTLAELALSRSLCVWTTLFHMDGILVGGGNSEVIKDQHRATLSILFKLKVLWL